MRRRLTTTLFVAFFSFNLPRADGLDAHLGTRRNFLRIASSTACLGTTTVAVPKAIAGELCPIEPKPSDNCGGDVGTMYNDNSPQKRSSPPPPKPSVEKNTPTSNLAQNVPDLKSVISSAKSTPSITPLTHGL